MKKQEVFPGKICALILACNEETSVGEIIRGTKVYIDTVFLIDNASTDNTVEVAKQNGAQVIRYYEKKGYGAAQYAGHAAVIQEDYDYVLQLDADGQHNPKYIPLLLEAVQNDYYDIVFGSRFLTDSYQDLPFVRRIGISFFSKMVGFLGHTRITDVTSGFKIYKVSSLKKLHKPSDKHPAVEQMLEMAKRGMKLKEVPIEMPVRKTGKSHLNLVRFVLYPFRVMWSISKVMLFR